jgi:hypothetical protein
MSDCEGKVIMKIIFSSDFENFGLIGTSNLMMEKKIR